MTGLLHTVASLADPGHERTLYITLKQFSAPGRETMPSAVSSAALMARLGLMPELIVVGIPNVSGEGRDRDLTTEQAAGRQ